MIVQHNLSAMNAGRMFGITNTAFAKSAEKLSSGYKVNRAADDAVGLAISEVMRRLVRGLTQASSNAQDGVSLVQTADGALVEVHDMLQRMNELLVKSSNGTNEDEDREYIQNEVAQLKTEINRIATDTEFNNIKLFTGNLASTPFRVYTDDNIIGIEDFYNAEITPSGSNGVGSYTALANQLATQIVPQAVNKILNAFPQAFGYLNGSSVGIGLNIENNPNTSALASVSMGLGGALSDGEISIYKNYKLTVNVAYLTLNGSGELTEDSRMHLEGTIVHEMMHAFMDESLAAGMSGRMDITASSSSAERFPTWFMEGMAQTMVGGYADFNDYVNGSLGIDETTSLDQIASKINSSTASLNNSSSNKAIYGTGYLRTMYLGYLAGGGGTVTPSNIRNGLDKILADLISGKSFNDVITPLDNAGSNEEYYQFIHDLTVETGSGNGSVLGSSFTETDMLPNSNASNSLFNLDTEHSNVKNTYPSDINPLSGGTKTLTGTSPTGATPGGGTGGEDPGGGTGGGEDPGGGSITPPPPTLPGDGIWIQAGTEAGQGFTIVLEDMDCVSLGIDAVDASMQNTASDGILQVKNAIKKVSSLRANLGAYQNRLEHTINNLNNVVENTQSAESKIRDTDMSLEMVKYSNHSILLQAGQSMLAQSKKMNESVLSLLQ